MHREAIKNIVFGGFCELIRDPRYYYHSSVGPEYCRFTDQGEKALKDFMNNIAPAMFQAEKADLDKRAKELVLSGLKGETP